MKKYSLLMFILIFSGCGASPTIQKGAERVQITNTLVDSSQMVRVGEVNCEYGINARMTATNVNYCRTELKNKAYNMGANVVVIENQSIGNPGCANCVSMFGTAYKSSNTIINK